MTLTNLFQSEAGINSDYTVANASRAGQSADHRASQKGFDQYLTALDQKESERVKSTETSRSQQKDNTKQVKKTDTKKTSDDNEPTVSERPEEPVRKTKSTNKTTQAGESRCEAATEAEKEIVSKVADALDVPVECIMQWLVELNMSPLDLTDPQAVNALLQKAFDVQSPMAALTMPEFQAAFEMLNEMMSPYKPLAEANKSAGFADLAGLQVVTDDEGQAVVVNAETATADTQVESEGLVETEATPSIKELQSDSPVEAKQGQSSSTVTATPNDAAANAAHEGTASQQENDFLFDAETMPQSMAATTLGNANARFAEVSAARTNANPVDATDVMNQIMSRVRVQSGDQFAELRITLRPENLGDVTLKVMTQNGIVTAQFIAENQRVKEVLEANFNQLKDVLQQQGVQISELSVSVRQEDDNNQERMNQFLRAQQSGRRRLQRVTGITAAAEAAETEAVPLADSSDVLLNTVDFTA